MPLILPDAPARSPSLSNPSTFEADNSAMLAWFKLLVDTMQDKSVLVQGDHGLGVTALPPVLTDIDATNTPTGSYRFLNGSGTKPVGSSPYAMVRVDRYDADTLSLWWVDFSGVHLNRFCDNGSWGPWKRLDPDRGSNINGEYVRYADGTQACWGAVATSGSGGVSWTFPAAFLQASTTRIVATPESGLTRSLSPVTNGKTATKVDVSVYDSNDARVNTSAVMFAAGRWY